MRVGRGGRNVHVLLASRPEDDGGDEHQDSGNTEGDCRPVLAQEDGHEQRGEERPEIDGPVERIEHDLRDVFVRLVELIADERHDEWFDAARTERDQEQPGVEAGAVVVERGEARVPHAVDERQPQDRAVLAEDPIGDPATEEREEVHADHEGVKDILGDPGTLGFRCVQQQRGDQERRQDVAHPVEAEALARLVADDVRDLSWQCRLGEGLGSFGGGHR